MRDKYPDRPSCYHRSPPFSGATDLADPDHMALDSTRPHHLLHPVRPREVDHDGSPTQADEHLYKNVLRSNNSASTDTINATARYAADDDSVSSMRSRRLVSGYLFGNPPSPGSRDAHLQDEGTARPEASRSPTEMSLSGLDDQIRTAASSRPVSPGRNAHYDHDLNGVRDGEADADDRARLKVGRDSAAYMRHEQHAEYHFPQHRLKRRMKDESKIPLVIVACGSFSPPTYLHLRMFEMAKDEIVESQTYEIMAGYYSPVSSHYKKAGLAPAHHRVRMCELAVEHTSTWLMVDPWEAGQPEYQRTAVVLDHFDDMLNSNGGVEMADGSRRKYKIMLLAGGDLIESFGEPGVWSEPDLHIILGRFGCLIVERAGSDVWAFLLSHDILYHHRRNVIVIKQLIYNDISSTKVRWVTIVGMHQIQPS